MTITVKRSTDGGAPSLINTAGSLITLLDYLLVTTLGWTKPYTGTNLAAYKQPSGSNQMYLYVDDTGTTAARVSGYEAMTSISSGTGNFPTSVQQSGGLYWGKSSAGSNRPWLFWSNGKIFYLFVQYNGTNWLGHCFGDFTSYKSSDAYGTIIIGDASSPTSATAFSSLVSAVSSSTAGGHFVARQYTQIGSSLAVGKISNYAMSAGNLGASGITYPCPIDGGLHQAPVWISEVTAGAGARGLLPGIWNPLHVAPLTHGDTFSGTGVLAGRTFEAVSLGSGGQCFVETSDTWGGF